MLIFPTEAPCQEELKQRERELQVREAGLTPGQDEQLTLVTDGQPLQSEMEEEEVKAKPLRSSLRRKLWTVDPKEGVDLAMGESGIEADEPITVGQMFQETVSKYPDHPALRYKVDGTWSSITYSEYYKHCIRAAKSFLKVGRASAVEDHIMHM